MTDAAQFQFQALQIVTAVMVIGGAVAVPLMVWGMRLSMVVGPDNRRRRIMAIWEAQNARDADPLLRTP